MPQLRFKVVDTTAIINHVFISFSAVQICDLSFFPFCGKNDLSYIHLYDLFMLLSMFDDRHPVVPASSGPGSSPGQGTLCRVVRQEN